MSSKCTDRQLAKSYAKRGNTPEVEIRDKSVAPFGSEGGETLRGLMGVGLAMGSLGVELHSDFFPVPALAIVLVLKSFCYAPEQAQWNTASISPTQS